MIEMLIAMVLSSIVVYAGISMFLASRGTASTTAAVGAVTDSGRVALDFIGDSVRGGGAMQCNAINAVRGQIINAATPLTLRSIMNAGATPLQLDYAHAFGGFEAAGTAPGGTPIMANTPIVADPAGSDWSTTGGGALDALLLNRVVKGSDVLAVRESAAQNAAVYTMAPYTSGSGQVAITVNDVGNLQPLQYAVISNCAFSTVFQINTVSAATQTITTNGPLDTGSGDLQWDYQEGSAINGVDMTVYFIAPGRDTDSALFSYDEWTGQFQQLVPDVENMQLLYGVAQSLPNQVTNYVTADQVQDFNQVVSVQVALLIASPPGTRAVAQPPAAPTFNLLGTLVSAPLDERMRKVFQTTIGVQNAAD